jgi:DNA adenine methylase
MSARPVVKWAGGKSKLVPELLKHVPAEIGTYVEPFAGGAALFFALSASWAMRKPKAARLSDMNAELINFYVVLRDRVRELIDTLEAPENAFVYKKENFLMWRARMPHELGSVVRAARFLYLNRTCFNGLYRVNKLGAFNVPFGDYTNPRICDREGLSLAAVALRGVSLSTCEFFAPFHGLGEGDLVYFDPPYDPISDTANFTSYQKGGFQWADQERLAKLAADLAWRGMTVIASNADTPRIRALWGDLKFTIHEVKASRAINSAGEKRGKVSELIMVRGPS